MAPGIGTLPGEPLAIPRVRQLWLRMTEIYGHKWTSAYGEDAESGAGETWAVGLCGLTARDINTGLSAAIVSTDPWPPSLPMFRAMCLGIPSLAAVKTAIYSRATPSPFLRQVWKKVDSYKLRNEDTFEVDRMIREAYELAREHVMLGRELPPEPVAVIQQLRPEPKYADPEEARRIIGEIEQRLNIATAESESASENGKAGAA